MAIITISRQLGSLGDEFGQEIADALGYKCFDKDWIEKRILALGFDPKKLKYYDETRVKFFDSIRRERDQYMYYLMTAVYEAASTNNCVIIGRGSFLMLSDVINHFSLRFVAEPELRIKRIMEKRNCTEKEAKKIIRKDDLGRWAFHKTFFRYDLNNPAKFHMILNTGLINGQEAANFVASGIKKAASPEIEEKGMSRINELLLSQRITNYLAFIAEIPINDLHVFMNGKTITLYGLTDYSATVEKAKTLLRAEFSDYEIISKIDCVQDAKTK